MTRALLRDTRSLDYWSSDCGHQKVFRLRMLYTNTILDLKKLTLGIGKLVIDVSPIWKSICRTTSPERRTPMPPIPTSLEPEASNPKP